jgi:hypothetical protein
MPEPSGAQESPSADETRLLSAICRAGVLSFISASILLVQTVVTFLMLLDIASAGPRVAILAIPLSGLTGLACLIRGVQLVRVTVVNIEFYGILLIVSGFLNCGFGTLLFFALHVGGDHDMFYCWHEHDRVHAMLLGGVSFLAGIGLLAGGVLAWRNRREYQLWREERIA